MSNPRQGFIANWNTKPSDEHYLQQNGGEEYWGTIYHSEPIAQALSTQQRLSPTELTAIEANIGTIDDADSRPAAPYFLPKLFRAYDRTPSLHTPQRDEAIAALRTWNQVDTIGSVGMSINTQWMQALEQGVFGADGVVPFAANGQDFTGKGTFNLLWHDLDGTRGLVPCDRMCATYDYFDGKPDQLMMQALDDALALLAGTDVLPGTHGAHGFGTTDITKWGWVAAQNKDWSDLDPIANTAADLGLLVKPDLGHERDPESQHLDAGNGCRPGDHHRRKRAPARRERLHLKRRNLQPTLRRPSPALRWLRLQTDGAQESVNDCTPPTRSSPNCPWGTARARDQGMCKPEMLRATTRRWISEVPSKIV